MTFSPKLARVVRRVLLTFAVLATAVLAVVLIENWRGDRAWAAYAAKARAAGVQFEEIPAPSRLPAARNFMTTPALSQWLWRPGSDSECRSYLEGLAVPVVPWSEMWKNGRRFDLALLPTVAAPKDSPEAARARVGVVVEELREAARARPDSELQRPEPITRKGFVTARLPKFEVARSYSMALGLDACRALADGRGDEALHDVLAQLKLAQGFCAAPDCVLLEAMIGSVLADAAMQGVWEGIDRRAWSDDQLRQLISGLEAVDVPAGLERAIEVERIVLLAMLDDMAAGRLWLPTREYMAKHFPWMMRLVQGMPRGWVQQNKIAESEVVALAIDAVAARRSADFLSFRGRLRDWERQIDDAVGPYNFLVPVMTPAYTKILDPSIRSAAYIDLAIVACALERYRIAHGRYPEAVTQLVPEFLAHLPRDPFDGQPLRYARRSDGGFTLYSVGLDGRDDGGSPGNPEAQSDDASGDWCWPRAVPAP